MGKSRPCTEEEFSQKYDQYGKMLFRMCVVILCNRQDAEDVVQDTFAKYLQNRPDFSSAEHEKAWFLRVAENRCRDKRRAAFFKRTVSLEEKEEYTQTPEESEILDQIAALPMRCKSVLYLHYVEGYKVREVAEILHIHENAVKTALCRGRQILKTELKEELA